MRILRTLIVFLVFEALTAFRIEKDTILFQMDTIFIESQGSLNELLEQFRGRVIYLDMWATFCTPCIQEFEHEKDLIPFFEKCNIVSLFICVDRDETKEKWKQIIANKSVTGYHTFVPLKQVDKYKAGVQMSKEGYQILGHGFPQFLIVGKDGRILEEFANRPSEKEKLFEQLAKYIDR